MNNLPDKNEKYIDDTEKCPSCEEYSYHDGVCENCGIGKADENLKSRVKKQTSKIGEQIKDNFKEKGINLKVDYLKYSSYKIVVINGKINEIHFNFNQRIGKAKKFRVIINYDLIKKQIKETAFYETEKEEREKIFNISRIEKIYIKAIQGKAKVGYKLTKHPNYYKFMGINIQNILDFTKKVVKKYHNID